MLSVKEGARFKVFTPAMLKMVNALNELSIGGYEIFITSVNDSTHLPTSKHYIDSAIDFRSHNFTKAQKTVVKAKLESILGDKFTVLLEDESLPNEHFHVQVKKGMAYP